MDALIFSAVFTLSGCAVAMMAKAMDRRILASSAVLFVLYLSVDDLVTGLPGVLPALHFIPGSWNWLGKILSLAFSAIVMASLRLSPDAVGLRRQEHSQIAWVALCLFVVWGACLGVYFRPGVPDAETLAFQATMPGIAEELAYRGIAPAILLALMRRKPHVEGIPWAVILATSAMFGLWHALGVSSGHIEVDLMSGLFPFIGSIAGGWLRFKTRSLLVPVLGHSLANVAFHMAGALAD
ncbi:MAG: CPBP family intramembrane metalloprotease [Burkholderiales bacterium]|nr:CPBP family intramembrane metalloprotease [Burkholderiales bacterium]